MIGTTLAAISLLSLVCALSDDEKISAMIKWGFNFFNVASGYHSKKNKLIESNLEEILSESDFQLAVNVMNEKIQMNSDQLAYWFLLANELLAAGEAVERTADVFVSVASQQDVQLSSGLFELPLWEAVKAAINADSKCAVRMEDGAVWLEGEDVTPENKSTTLNLALNLSVFHQELHITNLPLNLQDARLIQRVLQPHLIAIGFESCPFVWSFHHEFYFDFSSLKLLNRFQCTGCCNTNLLPMLETISSPSLTHLSVTNYEILESDRVMKLILNYKTLQYLSFVSEKSSPCVTGQIFDLKQLKFLDVTRSAVAKSLAEKLSDLSEPLDMEHLNISYSCFYGAFEIFCRNFGKLPRLKYLNLNYCGFSWGILIDYIDRLNLVGQLVLPKNDFVHEHYELFNRICKLQLPIAVVENHVSVVRRAQHLEHCTRVNMHHADFMLANNLKLNVNLVSHLTCYPSNSWCPAAYRQFYQRFRALRSVSVVFEDGTDDFTLLCELLSLNPIEHVSVVFVPSFVQFSGVMESMKEKGIKELTLALPNCGNVPYVSLLLLMPKMVHVKESALAFCFSSIVSSFTKADCWSELQVLEMPEIPFEFVLSILQSVQLPRLRKLSFRINNVSQNDCVECQFRGIRELRVVSEEGGASNLASVLLHFPRLISLEVVSNERAVDWFDFSALRCLRRLTVEYTKMENEALFLQSLTKLPLLTHLTLKREGTFCIRRVFDFSLLQHLTVFQVNYASFENQQ